VHLCVCSVVCAPVPFNYTATDTETQAGINTGNKTRIELEIDVDINTKIDVDIDRYLSIVIHSFISSSTRAAFDRDCVLRHGQYGVYIWCGGVYSNTHNVFHSQMANLPRKTTWNIPR